MAPKLLKEKTYFGHFGVVKKITEDSVFEDQIIILNLNCVGKSREDAGHSPYLLRPHGTSLPVPGHQPGQLVRDRNVSVSFCHHGGDCTLPSLPVPCGSPVHGHQRPQTTSSTHYNHADVDTSFQKPP